MARGPEYADRLTGAERRTLDALLAELDRHDPPAPAPRRSWRAPVAAGLAALVILSGATIASQLGRPAPPAAPAATGEPAPPAETLAELATAAASLPDPPHSGNGWYRRRLHVIIDGESEPCQVVAVTTQIWEDPAPGAGKPRSGDLLAERVSPSGPATARAYQPDPATGWPGCAEPAVAEPDPVRLEGHGDVTKTWEELINWLGDALPRPGEPPLWGFLLGPEENPDRAAEALRHQLDELTAATAQNGPDPDGQWWVGLVTLLTNPEADGTLRAGALGAIADRSDVSAVPEVTADHTGRLGTTLRVPYGDRAAAELTFDPNTGALLQRVVYAESSAEITAYLESRPR